jgi:hypothetical protein
MTDTLKEKWNASALSEGAMLLPTSLFWVTYMAILLWEPDFTLYLSKSPVNSQATGAGIDVSLRIGYLYRLVFFGLVAIPLVQWLLLWLIRRLAIRAHGRHALATLGQPYHSP